MDAEGRRTGSPITMGEIAVVGVLIALGAVLRIYAIGDEPIRNDEVATIVFARVPLDELWGRDTHPPLYYAIMHFWLGFGDGTAALRSLSALFGTLTIPLVYGLGRAVGDARTGAVAALLFAVSPFNVAFAQEARMYAQLTWAATVAMTCLAWLLRSELGNLTRDRPAGHGGSAWLWGGYVAGLDLALYTHNTAALLLGAAIVVGVVWISAGRFDRRFRRRWLASHVVVIACWAVYGPALLAQVDRVYRRFWLEPPTLDSITAAMTRLHLWTEPAILLWVALAAAAVGVWATRRRPLWLVFLGVFILAAPIGEILVSIVRPIFYDRTLIWTTVPFIVVVALGINAMRPGPVAVTAIALIAAGNAAAVARLGQEITSPRWDLAAAHIAAHYRPGDLLAFNPNHWHENLRYYLRHRVPDFAMHRIEPGIVGPDAAPRFIDAIKDAGRVWLIIDESGFHDPAGVLKPAFFARHPIALQWTDGRIGVHLSCDPARWAELECPGVAPTP